MVNRSQRTKKKKSGERDYWLAGAWGSLLGVPVITWMYTYINIYWAVHLRSVHSTVCKLYLKKEMPFSHKKECSTDTCYNMDEPWKNYAKWKKAATKGDLLYDSIYMQCPRIGKFTDRK